MKSFIVSGLILGALSGTAAVARPYANVENNAGWTGGDFVATITEVHVGYEFEAGEDVDIYVQAGPAFVAKDGDPTQTEISGKVGVEADVTKNLALYGEVALVTEDQDFNDIGLATKVGATLRF